jgi:hypothetical protein
MGASTSTNSVSPLPLSSHKVNLETQPREEKSEKIAKYRQDHDCCDAISLRSRNKKSQQRIAFVRELGFPDSRARNHITKARCA